MQPLPRYLWHQPLGQKVPTSGVKRYPPMWSKGPHPWDQYIPTSGGRPPNSRSYIPLGWQCPGQDVTIGRSPYIWSYILSGCMDLQKNQGTVGPIAGPFLGPIPTNRTFWKIFSCWVDRVFLLGGQNFGMRWKAFFSKICKKNWKKKVIDKKKYPLAKKNHTRKDFGKHTSSPNHKCCNPRKVSLKNVSQG